VYLQRPDRSLVLVNSSACTPNPAHIRILNDRLIPVATIPGDTQMQQFLSAAESTDACRRYTAGSVTNYVVSGSEQLHLRWEARDSGSGVGTVVVAAGARTCSMTAHDGIDEAVCDLGTQEGSTFRLSIQVADHAGNINSATTGIFTVNSFAVVPGALDAPEVFRSKSEVIVAFDSTAINVDPTWQASYLVAVGTSTAPEAFRLFTMLSLPVAAGPQRIAVGNASDLPQASFSVTMRAVFPNGAQEDVTVAYMYVQTLLASCAVSALARGTGRLTVDLAWSCSSLMYWFSLGSKY